MKDKNTCTFYGCKEPRVSYHHTYCDEHRRLIARESAKGTWIGMKVVKENWSKEWESLEDDEKLLSIILYKIEQSPVLPPADLVRFTIDLIRSRSVWRTMQPPPA